MGDGWVCKDIDIEYVWQVLRYNPETGDLVWKERPLTLFKEERIGKSWNSRYSGQVAGTLKKGYLMVYLKGSQFAAHRIVWAMVKGEQPPAVIDHINGNPLDNRIENLRESTPQDNAKNMFAPITNTSGVVGVHWSATRCRWVAQGYVTEDGKAKTIPLGRFVEFEDAVEARRRWEIEKGYSARHGETKEVQ